MKEELYKILENAKQEIKNIKSFVDLDNIRAKFLGKKSPIRDVLSKLGQIEENLRRELGEAANKVKDEITMLIDEAEKNLIIAQKKKELETGVSDISLPLKVPDTGYPHPISLVIEKMITIFKSMGYTVVEGPELEEEKYNFDMLNIPPHHPARDDHDSFFVLPGLLLRTHTSPVQIRTMLKMKPPIAIVVPGRCFRRDALDATHSHTFHQMEGLVVDKNISFADLKGTLLLWAKMMFGENTQIRLRPDFFPFTEPSAELAVTCPVCGGKKCNVCKRTGWVELMGCGMVNPVVLENCGIDPEVYSGFAFGLGVERVAMTVYGINDIRYFYENDLRLLEQFGR
jgi:phenylalanyl-tRNA synthetase alpha chain